ncbi:MAG TPA: hypothetical protein VGQ64_11925 [Candidatus Limnocylindrales bacterium]|nr:hypothetical protein [Candidatus Limnocylindrales bacterium]
MALLDAAARLRPIFERDELLAADLADDLRADRGVRDDRTADRRLVAVGDEEDAVEGDGLTRFGVEQLDFEFGADLDAVLLSAGLDDCVQGSSGLCEAIARSDRDGGQGEALGRPRHEREVYAHAPGASIERGAR